MKVRIKEDLDNIKDLIGRIDASFPSSSKETTSSGSWDAVLVGGLDYRKGDYPIDEQVRILQKGYGTSKRVKGFRYNTSTSEIINFLRKNPNIDVFLFSAGCDKADSLASSGVVNLDKMYIIEPYAASSGTKSRVQSAVGQGVPQSNVYVGSSSGRGKGVVSGASSSGSSSHWGSLTSVGSMQV